MSNNSEYSKLEPILFEMEINHVERGNLYVSLDGDFMDEIILTNGWPLPTETGPGEWRTVENSKIDLSSGFGMSQLLNLYTLSGLLLFSKIKNRLFSAEYEGDSLEILSNVYPVKGDESVFYLRGIKKGVSVSKARLVERIIGWNDYSAFNFACDCAESAIMNNIKVHGYSSEVNNEGLVFASALGKYQFLDDPTDIEVILGKKFSDKKDLNM